MLTFADSYRERREQIIRESIFGAALLIGMALVLPLRRALADGCEMQIPASWSASCPSEGCPPFKPCQPRLAQQEFKRIIVVVCTCGATGQLPYCCVVASERAWPNMPTGFGHCDSFCQTTGDCTAQFNSQTGLYEAVCVP